MVSVPVFKIPYMLSSRRAPHLSPGERPPRLTAWRTQRPTRELNPAGQLGRLVHRHNACRPSVARPGGTCHLSYSGCRPAALTRSCRCLGSPARSVPPVVFEPTSVAFQATALPHKLEWHEGLVCCYAKGTWLATTATQDSVLCRMRTTTVYLGTTRYNHMAMWPTL